MTRETRAIPNAEKDGNRRLYYDRAVDLGSRALSDAGIADSLTLSDLVALASPTYAAHCNLQRHAALPPSSPEKQEVLSENSGAMVEGPTFVQSLVVCPDPTRVCVHSLTMPGRWTRGHSGRPTLLPNRHHQDAFAVFSRLCTRWWAQWDLQGYR